MSNEANTLRDGGAIAESWRHFETEILPRVAHDLPPELMELSRMSFYFGALMVLNLVQPLSERSAREEQLQTAISAFKGEVQAYLLARTKG